MGAERPYTFHEVPGVPGSTGGRSVAAERRRRGPTVLEVSQPSVLHHVDMPPVDLNANTPWHRVNASPSKQMRWIWGGQADMVK